MLLIDSVFSMFRSCAMLLHVCVILCRTETVVEKLLTNWMSICLYAFLRVSQHKSSDAQ